ncbi:hypothetical protein WH52_12400 [Tenacibaculum holothuriorum]|uniref:Outer membrane protein beta-barrel domain-containing protein n=1 Tax=Tenacibaculum holothuriorum TaxID=1635173 RepID=A0A1Y2P9Y5_9FLAO|nr:DUF6588 family protein [Tenacibaculum holothuriorum]OSY87255.1 hypothetical protein WH52_12400 [Tenacibaculum holothuriorum]
MKKITLLAATFFAFSTSMKAQDGFEQALLGTTQDAGKLVQGYFNPGIEGLINSMNNGWYHTAKVHKKFGFDLSIALNGAFIPSSKETFNIQETLGPNSSITSNSTIASTFAGPDTPTTFTVTRQLNVPGAGTQTVTANFELPGGITDDLPIKAVPAPAVQLTLGLPFKMEVMGRFFPETKIGDDGGKISMYGIGLKKEITSWFGPLDKTPLHVSLLAAYTSLDLSYGLGSTTSGALQVQDGAAEFGLSAFTIQAIASLNFPIINFYGGVGFNTGSADLKMTGNYTGTYQYTPAGGGTSIPVTENLSPPSLSFNSSGLKATIGTRLSLGFFKIFADYSLQEYNTVNAGIAFSFR